MLINVDYVNLVFVIKDLYKHIHLCILLAQINYSARTLCSHPSQRDDTMMLTIISSHKYYYE